MSFSLTTEQYRNLTKTVTRRLGWRNLKPGEAFMGVVKGMGLKKGEKVERIHASVCIANHRETLSTITPQDVIREGFSGMTPKEFVAMFCKHNRCKPSKRVNRIEFEHVVKTIPLR
jgi:hypothetical protein